jgi:hypothetical protein
MLNAHRTDQKQVRAHKSTKSSKLVYFFLRRNRGIIQQASKQQENAVNKKGKNLQETQHRENRHEQQPARLGV